MSKLNLYDALSAIDIQADWVGLREVKESTTYRIIRVLQVSSVSERGRVGVEVGVLGSR